ncbi:MAG: crossover junction endodeoxyribonuclease RuvC [Bryobacterales bacterium]|nr:crossover junction endodeoxyribonuclease RuvC [Bryobacteraceae bacterium]MDW8353281.1 crossover junction endodeoxyribonuclease RuvC [Bryobacterales bacterium]
MRVLGIDCGADRTGYGIIDSDGRAHRLIEAGVISSRGEEPWERRLLTLARGLRQVIATHHPETAAVEEVFVAANAQAALRLAQVRGAALLTLAEAGLPVGEYSPLEVKTSVTGYGRAEKRQVQRMVGSLLGLDRVPESEDASDALAVAICHATRLPVEVRP